MAISGIVPDDSDKTRERLRAHLEATAKREAELGREGFVSLPNRLQQELSVLQDKSSPKNDSHESLLGAESILEQYNKRLDDAFNLVAQVAGEAGRQRAFRNRRAVRVGVLAAIVAAVVLGAAASYRFELSAKAELCTAAPSCKELGLCGAGLRTEDGFAFECRAQSDEDCTKSYGCQKTGRCRAVAGECVAATDEDCVSTERCRLEGWCSAKQGRCIAATMQDCRRTEACTQRGACTPVGEVCKPGSDADCRLSDLCKAQGACELVGDLCVTPPDWDADAGADAGRKR